MILEKLKIKAVKYKDIIIRLLTGILFVLLFFSICRILDSSFEFTTEQYKKHEILPLNTGEEITQYLDINSGYLKGFSIVFGTYLRVNEGDVEVAFKEDDRIIHQWCFKAEELGDDVYKKFIFDNPVQLNGKSRYSISVTETFTGENFVAVYLTTGGKSLYSSDAGLKDHYTLCYQLNFVEKQYDSYRNILGLAIFIVLVFGFISSVCISDFTKDKMIHTALLVIMIAILFFSAGSDVLQKVNKNVTVSKYSSKLSAATILPGASEEFLVDASQDSFHSMEFYILNEYDGDIAISLSDSEGRIYFEHYKVPEQNYIPETEKGTGAIKIDISQSEIQMEKFPLGQYTMSIANLDSASELAINVKGADTSKLNVVLKRRSMLGVVISFVILLLLVCYLFIIFNLIERSRLNIEGFYLVSAVFLFGVCLVLLQAWNVPDSRVHFLACYRQSNLLLGHWGEAAWQGRACDIGYIHSLWRDSNPDMAGILNVIHNFQIFATDIVMLDMPKATHMEYYSVLNYLPQVIGLTVGRILNFGSVLTIYLGRLGIVAAYIGVCYHIIKTTPVGKGIFAVIALLPSSVMLGSSFSYDAMALLSSMGFTACVLRLYKKDSKKAWIECLIWAFFLGGVKAGGFLILLPLVLLLLRKKDNKYKKYFITISTMALFAVLLFDLVIPAGSQLFQFGEEGTGKMAAAFAFTNPIEYLRMMLGAYIRYFDELIIELSGSTFKEEVIPITITFGMLFIGVIYSLLEEDVLKFHRKDKYLLEFIVILAILFTPVMLLSWTPNGSEVIEGLQGRYYLPVLPTAYLALTKFKTHTYMQINNKEGEKFIRGKCFKYLCICYCVSVYYLLRLYITR